MDLAAPDGPALLVEKAIGEHGRVDVLVNNVGAVRLRLDGFLGTSDEEFEWAMQMNFFTALRATRAALGPMLEQGGGTVVNVASVNAFFQPDAGTIDYGAAKAALVNLTKSLSQEFGPQGIRVNAVSPGPVSTDLWLGDHGVAETVAAASGVDVDTARETVVAGIGGFATGRFTTPEEVATLIAMLASDRTANVTGANYVIDGGLIKTTDASRQDGVQEAGEARVEILAAQGVQPCGSVGPLTDHAGLAQHPEVVRAGGLAHLHVEAAGGTRVRAGVERRDDLQPGRVAQRVQHRAEVDVFACGWSAGCGRGHSVHCYIRRSSNI